MDTMRERFTAVTTELLDEDPRLAVVLAVISGDRFTAAARAHPGRVIDVGIREQLLVSVAGGLALSGLRPIAHTFASFLVERPFEQVKLDLNHQDAGAVLVSAGASYDIAVGGRTHQSPGDVALLDTLGDWTVHVPGHPDEAEALLRHAAADGDRRVYLRLSDQANRDPRPVEPGRFTTVRPGNGTGPVIVAVGPMLDAVLDATTDLTGQDATVLYAATVRPFDTAGLRAALDGTPDQPGPSHLSGRPDPPGGTHGRDVRSPRPVVLVEPYLKGTSVPYVAEALHDRPHRLLALGTARTELRRYGSRREHVAAHGLDARGLREQIAAFTAAG